jgi:hypothetical protein
MLVIMRRLVMRRTVQFLVRVGMRLRTVRMGMRVLPRLVRFIVLMIVAVSMVVNVAVRVAVDEIAVAMRMIVDVFVRMRVVVTVRCGLLLLRHEGSPLANCALTAESNRARVLVHYAG